MSKLKLKKFCNIPKYIELTDPNLKKLLDNLCLWPMFRPRRGHVGVSFIWPTAKAVTDLVKMSESEDIDKCAEIMSAHIIHDYLPSVAAWNSKKTDIPNGMGRKIEVKTATGSTVMLVDDSELKLDDKYVGFGRGVNQAVWRVVKGNFDHSKHKRQATFEHARESATGAPKHREPAHNEKSPHRDQLKKTVSGLGAMATGGGRVDGPFGYLVAFQKHVETNGSAEALLELRIILDANMITSLVFATRPNSCLHELLESFNESPDYVPGLHGMTDYLDMIEKNHAVINKAGGTRGGGVEEFLGALTMAISAAHASSEKALAQLPKLDSRFDADTFTRLNLSRMMESDVLSKPPKNPAFAGEWVEDLRVLIGVVSDRASGKCIETKKATSTFGALVAGLLKSVREFNESAYSIYPLGSSASAVRKHDRATAEKVYADSSVTSILSKLSPKQLSDLFENVPAS